MGNFNPAYITMIIVGFVIGVALYFVNSFILSKDTTQNKIKALIVFAVSILPAIALGFTFNYITHPTAHGLPFSEASGYAFHFFYGIVFFFLCSWVLLWLAKLNVKKYLNIVAPSIILVSAIFKIGCIFAGCCGGIEISGVVVPTAEIECGVGFILFFLFQFFLKENRLRNYLLIYAPFRFVIEFLREKTNSIMLLNFLKPEQFLAILLAVILVINYKYFSENNDTLNRRINEKQ